MKVDVINTRMLYQGISLLLLFLIIPILITIQEPLKKNSLHSMTSLQKLRLPGFTWFISSVKYITPDLLHAIICPFILNFYHPLRVPKTILFYTLSFYLSNLLALMFQEGRPFWYSTKIKPILCLAGYGNPSYQIILATIVLCSISIELLHKSKLRYFVYPVTISLVLLISFGFWYLSENFPHQVAISLFLSFILITFKYSFEKNLLKFSNECCYKYSKNRVWIVYSLLACFSMVMLFGAINLMVLSFYPESTKLINNSTEHCPNSYNPDGSTNIESCASVFYIFAYITGSLLLSEKMTIFYTMTEVWKRFIRFFITAGSLFGVYLLFHMIPTNDYLTRSFLHRVVPNLIAGFSTTFLFPFLFKFMKITLVIPMNLNKEERKKLFSFKKSVI